MFESRRGHDALGLLGPACAHPPGVSSELPASMHALLGKSGSASQTAPTVGMTTNTAQPRSRQRNGVTAETDNRNRVHSMFVEHNPCGVGMVEDQYGNCVPTPSGGGGPTGPGCPYNCGGSGGTGGSGGCIMYPNSPGCGGGPVALMPPKLGQGCDGSQLQLGSQWPVNTKNYANEVTNIFPLVASDANGAPGIVGWLYQVGGPSGPMYVQGNSGTKTFWTSLAEGLPILGPLVSSFDDGTVIVPTTSSQSNEVRNYFYSHNGQAGSCFTGSLPRNEA